jgi:hypothetical protein
LRAAGERHRELMAASAMNIRKQQTILSPDGYTIIIPHSSSSSSSSSVVDCWLTEWCNNSTVDLNAIGLAPELTAALLDSESNGTYISSNLSFQSYGI